MPEFHCNLDRPGTALAQVWSHTIGSDHAHMALRADWQTQMRRVHQELGIGYVRFHALLDDDMATLLDEEDTLRYGFHNADLIVDFLRGIGMRPFVELSFMPTALASGTKTVFSYRGNVTPPNKLSDWDELIGQLVQHWIARYGIDEVRQWFFEVWNEPNLPAFWTGSQADYFELYRHTATTIKAIDAHLRVGGPAPAQLFDRGVEVLGREPRLGECAADIGVLSKRHRQKDALDRDVAVAGLLGDLLGLVEYPDRVAVQRRRLRRAAPGYRRDLRDQSVNFALRRLGIASRGLD